MHKRGSHFYEFGPFRLDPARRLLFRQNQVISLPPKVLHTLLVLVENSGRIVGKEELMKALWPDTFVEEGNLTQNISTLRKVLGENPGEHVYIETIPKQGYRFIAGGATETAAVPWLRRHRGLMWAGVMTAVVGITAGLGWYFGQQPNVAHSLTVTPLTSYPGLELHPSFAPDGNQVAFAWDGERQDNLDIYVKVIGSDRSQRLTFDEARDFRPAWSPDGRWIAFLRATAGRQISIMRIPPTGGPEHKVAVVHPGYLASYDRAPLLEWTPDGRWLLTADRVPPDEASSLFLISVESGEKRRLTSPPPASLGDLTAAISADGRRIAFSRSQSSTLGRLCILEMSGGFTAAGEPNCFAISDGRLANFGCVRWTPDRREVMFSPLFRGSGQASLWTMPLPRRQGGVGVPQRFPIPSNSARDPAISRDGRRLVYTDFLVDADIWRLDLQNGVPTKPGATSAPVKLISSTQFDQAGEYSPDGKKIVFVSSRSGHPAVWVADNDGSNATQLTTLEFPLVGCPRWSPDGQRIVFDSTLEGQFELYRINEDGGGLRRLTHHPDGDAVASWSRDGQWIYFSSTRSGENQIWKMPANGGEPTQLTRQGGGHASSESVDGKFLYYARWVAGAPGLWRVPATGGEEVKVLDSIFPLNFTVAGSGIYFVAPTADGSSIQFLSFQTGKVTSVAPVDGPLQVGLSVSPDGRFLLYPMGQLVGSDLMLVENFR
jgi:Tol biopolymer transport system component/DNA-binding winged helix-turn-helix (wHTH) protein